MSFDLVKAEVFEKLWEDRKAFHQRSVEAFNAFARELRATLFEREEAFTSPNGLGLTLESSEVEYGVGVTVVLSESGRRVACAFSILTSKKGNEMITWVDLRKVLYIDPSHPETVTNLVTTILETLKGVLLPSEVPEENSSQADPRIAIPTARRIL